MSHAIPVNELEGSFEVEVRPCSEARPEYLTGPLALKESRPQVAHLLPSVVVEELGRWYASRHVKVRPVSKQGRVLLAHWQHKVREFREVQFPVVVVVISAEQKVDVVMSEAVKAYVVSKGHYYVLH